jgi:RimJ/RimL family protein N-acetyltransferase
MIYGDRIRFRHAERSDVPIFVNWLNDPEVRRNRSSEIGIIIGDKSAWNQGYGTESVRLLVKLGFETLNLNRIYLHVFETNPRAVKCYEKAGFVHEGRQRQGEWQDGRFIDVLVMSILQEEWRAQNA